MLLTQKNFPETPSSPASVFEICDPSTWSRGGAVGGWGINRVYWSEMSGCWMGDQVIIKEIMFMSQ